MLNTLDAILFILRVNASCSYRALRQLRSAKGCQLLCAPCLSGSPAFTKFKIEWFGKVEHILRKTERYIHVIGFFYPLFI